MNDSAVPTAPPADRPIFVLGERAAAMQLVRALGDTPAISAMPTVRLLTHLLLIADRCAATMEGLTDRASESLRAAAWYRDLQAAQLRGSGKRRTVEFSGLSILRLCGLFPSAQFLIVRQLTRTIPASRRPPRLGQGKILEVDSHDAVSPETLDRVLAFLGEIAEPAVAVDLSDQALRNLHAECPPGAMASSGDMPQGVR